MKDLDNKNGTWRRTVPGESNKITPTPWWAPGAIPKEIEQETNRKSKEIEQETNRKSKEIEQECVGCFKTWESETF